jgi:hypothetical protein
VLLEHLVEGFGLALEFGGRLGDLPDDLLVGEVLEAVVDLGPLLMLP